MAFEIFDDINIGIRRRGAYISLTGVRKLNNALEMIENHIADPIPVLEKAAEIISEAVTRNFEEERDAEPWKPNAPATVKSKHGSELILHDSGALFHAATDVGMGVEGGGVARITSQDSLEYGLDPNEWPQIWRELFGEREILKSRGPLYPAKRMNQHIHLEPIRNWLYLSPADKDKINQAFSDHISEIIGEATK